MIGDLALALVAALCAFAMGYALNQGSTCAVTAAREVIDQRRARMLVGFVIAICAAGLVWLPLTWVADGRVLLLPDRPIGWRLALGACLLGLGAVINGACLLGSISRIGDGRLRFLALPVGLGGGFFAADRFGLMPGPALPNLLAHPSEVAEAVLIAFAVVGAIAWSWMRRIGDPGDRERWPWRVAMTVLGVAGAVLFAIAPGWTVADAVRRGLAPLEGGMLAADMSRGPLGFLMFGVLIAGAAVAGVRRGAFRLRPPRMLGLFRSLAGGAVMALGASLIPGGNDSLILAGLPSATPSAVVAYAVMSATVFSLLLTETAIRRRLSPPGP